MSIIVVTHSYDVSGLIDSIDPTPHSIQWILHHHGSKRGKLASYLRKLENNSNVKIFWHCKNRGLAKSWNEGIQYAYSSGSELVFLINDDISFRTGGFNKFVDFILNNGRNDLCFAYGYEPQINKVRLQGFACCAIGRDIVDKIGYFDENFIPAYFEDVDYMHRLHIAGLNYHCDARDIVTHNRGGTARMNPFFRIKLRINKNFLKLYFDLKWGIVGSERTFTSPFNYSDYSVKINWSDREKPYGNSDCSIVIKKTHIIFGLYVLEYLEKTYNIVKNRYVYETMQVVLFLMYLTSEAVAADLIQCST